MWVTPADAEAVNPLPVCDTALDWTGDCELVTCDCGVFVTPTVIGPGARLVERSGPITEPGLVMMGRLREAVDMTFKIRDDGDDDNVCKDDDTSSVTNSDEDVSE